MAAYDAKPGLDHEIKQLRIIILALAMGLALFAVVIQVILAAGLDMSLPLPPSTGLMFSVASAMVILVGVFVRRRLVADLAGTSTDPDEVMGRYRTGVIAGSAVIEAGGLFGCMGAFITGSAGMALALGGLGVLGLLLVGMPKRDVLQEALRKLPS